MECRIKRQHQLTHTYKEASIEICDVLETGYDALFLLTVEFQLLASSSHFPLVHVLCNGPDSLADKRVMKQWRTNEKSM